MIKPTSAHALLILGTVSLILYSLAFYALGFSAGEEEASSQAAKTQDELRDRMSKLRQTRDILTREITECEVKSAAAQVRDCEQICAQEVSIVLAEVKEWSCTQ